ncbi:thiolase family protein [Streptomyces malaysiensis]|uniref:thiolase family protein n=1 Tax=Streptomyces malaysiensis TaxID=92644 RepID=UPI002B2D62CB|nr:thiolase family protein [Streptomyces malaysiensis]
MREVYVVGSAVTKVGKHEESGRELGRQVGVAALREAGLTFGDIDGVWAGVALGASPRAVFVAKELGLTGVPVQQVVNASASGLAAVHEAKLAIQSGEHDLVLVLGYDVPETAGTAEQAIQRQGFLPPVALFALWAAERSRTYGTTPGDLARVASKNWNYARHNPFAARQADHEVTPEEILASRTVAGALTSKMCTPWGDGAGAVILASREGLRRISAEAGVARIASSVLQSETYGEHHTFEGAVVGPRELTARTGRLALERAGIGIDDVDVVQVHDAFANEELEYAELLGFAPPGGAEALLRKGAFGPGSRRRFGLPEFSTDGGLLARGHASGASGIAQLHETRRRFADHDDHDDHVGLCHLVGAGSVCVVQVLVREDH